MVYGIAFCPLDKLEILKDLGCADSKALTEEKREAIFERMSKDELVIADVGWSADIISPNFICNNMYRRAKCSLNEVSMNSAINLLREVEESGIDIAEVYVDTVGPPEKYQDKLKALFPRYKITVAKKADSTYPIVSAASIVAKVTRDRTLKSWNFKEGLELTQKDYGSGYPGDPATKKFIKDQIDQVFGYPQLVRFSWSTAELALQDNAYTCTWEDSDETVNKKAKTSVRSKKINTFFSPDKSDMKAKKARHLYFTERCLSLTEDL